MTTFPYHRLSRLLIIGLILLISACSQTPSLVITEESEPRWNLRQQQLAGMNEWEIHARAAILLKDKVYPVGIDWRRQQADFKMVIEAPFGQGIIRIESNVSDDKNKQFKLTLTDGKHRLGPTPEILLNKLLGWSIPVSGLRSWVKGLPRPAVDYSYELYGTGQLKSLKQDGWLINYLTYFSATEQPQELPKKIYLKHKNLGIKIVIEQWADIEKIVEPDTIFPDFD